jgi:hypothetical protein
MCLMEAIGCVFCLPQAVHRQCSAHGQCAGHRAVLHTQGAQAGSHPRMVRQAATHTPAIHACPGRQPPMHGQVGSHPCMARQTAAHHGRQAATHAWPGRQRPMHDQVGSHPYMARQAATHACPGSHPCMDRQAGQVGSRPCRHKQRSLPVHGEEARGARRGGRCLCTRSRCFVRGGRCLCMVRWALPVHREEARGCESLPVHGGEAAACAQRERCFARGGGCCLCTWWGSLPMLGEAAWGPSRCLCMGRRPPPVHGVGVAAYARGSHEPLPPSPPTCAVGAQPCLHPAAGWRGRTCVHRSLPHPLLQLAAPTPYLLRPYGWTCMPPGGRADAPGVTATLHAECVHPCTTHHPSLEAPRRQQDPAPHDVAAACAWGGGHCLCTGAASARGGGRCLCAGWE